MRGHLALFVVSVCLLSCAQVKHVIKHESAADRYINRQMKIIEAHEGLLVKAGRITDAKHFMPELFLATYGWHSSCGDTQFCGSGSFGAYTFSEAAYEQAKRIYVIHGTVDAGTDILTDANYSFMIPDADGAIWSDSNGGHSPVGKGAFDPAIVGDTVGFLTYCQKYGNHVKYCDESGLRGATVIKFIDKGHVQISKKAEHDAEMYGLVITPPDYVDMCACTVPVSAPDPNVKPCVQGGTLNPGESCSVGMSSN